MNNFNWLPATELYKYALNRRLKTRYKHFIQDRSFCLFVGVLLIKGE